jgi:hypothetical protein
MKKNNPPLDLFVSTVVVTDNTSHDLDIEISSLSKELSGRYANYEILIIDNKLPPIELTKAIDLLATTPCVRIIRLSRQNSKDVCIFTGLEAAIGDVVVIKFTNDPVDLVSEFTSKAQENDIVFGVSKKRTRPGLINHYGAKFFYWYNKKFMGISIPERSTYYMALSRRAVNAVTRNRQFARHIRYLARQVGYESAELYYEPDMSQTLESRSLRTLLVSALELVTSYSKYPLRFVSWLGFAASLLNLLYVGYALIVHTVNKNVTPGWTTLSIQSSLMFFLLFMILAVLCEYIGQILQETRQTPLYHIADELNSKVSVADATRRNVVH